MREAAVGNNRERGSVDSSGSCIRVTDKTTEDERRSPFSLESLAVECVSVPSLRAIMPVGEGKPTVPHPEKALPDRAATDSVGIANPAAVRCVPEGGGLPQGGRRHGYTTRSGAI